jgi:hypothetical protein
MKNTNKKREPFGSLFLFVFKGFKPQNSSATQVASNVRQFKAGKMSLAFCNRRQVTFPNTEVADVRGELSSTGLLVGKLWIRFHTTLTNINTFVLFFF